MAYKVLEVVGLPVMEDREIHPGTIVPVATGEVVRKEPGDTITNKEMEAAGQTDDDIKALIADGAIEEG